MSKTIDERVVEMRFDNKQFEQNVQTSISSIEKLEKSLNLKGASKGLEDVNAAAESCNMAPLSNAVETVKVRFSALEVMAVTALANITNSALNAGKKIVSALTIDPIKTGFQEYETQINAVQTILANTQHEGTNLQQVNQALDELNTYADKTIYNFTEMTRNIGTFTAAGVNLQTSVDSIKGIANLAAISGSSAQQASTAMYQLSQAIAAGKVQLMDWNSVVNAGMGGKVFQDALVRTSELLGTGAKNAIEMYGSFRESLTKTGWLTTEVLTETLKQFAGAYDEADLIAQGFSESQAKEIMEMAKTAEDAATKVKTFTQLWDTLKESAQSGWTQTWEILIGDFEEAKEELTKLSDIFSGIIGDSANRRNAVLEGAFGSNWDTFIKKINTAGIETETFQKKVSELAQNHNVDLEAMIEKEGSFEKALKKAFNDGTLNKNVLKDAIKSLARDITGATKSTEEMAGQMEKYGEIVDQVIRGDFGSGEARIKALTEAGYDYATVQNLVNEKIGSSVRHISSLTEEQLKNADSLVSLSDAQLENNGYTEEQISALRDLQREAETAGSSIDELINDLEKPSGAELLWDSVLKVINNVVDSVGAVKQAWNDIFHQGMTEGEIIEEHSEKLYNLIKALNEFTGKLEITDEKANKITRTFKGLFAILDIIMTVTGGGLRLAFKGLSVILNAFDMDILDLTANVGDLISGFRDWILNNERVEKGIRAVAFGVKTACSEVKHWVDVFLNLPMVQKNIARFETAFRKTFSALDEYFKGGIERIDKFIERIKRMDNIALDNILKDFKDNVLDYFLDIDGRLDDLAKAIKDFKEDVRKHFSDVGNNLDELKGKTLDFVQSLKEKFSDHVGLGEILTIGIGGSLIIFVKKFGDALETLAGPVGDLAGIVSDFEKMIGSCSKAINAFAMKTKSKALINVAISIGILAASIVALTLVDQSKLWSAVGALGVLATGLLGVSTAMGALGKIGGGKGSTSMLGIAASLFILIQTLKSMEGLNSDKVWQNITILGTMASGLAIIAGLLGKFTPKLSKGSIAFIGIAAALKIMVSALQDIDSLHLSNIDQSIGILLGAMGGLVALAIICKNIKMGSAVSILATVIALKLFVGAFADIANLDTTKMKGNIENFVAIFGTFAALMISSKFAGTNAAKAGVGILAMSAALLLISACLKIFATMDASDLRKATGIVAQLLVLFAGVVAVSQFAGANAAKAGTMLLLMSGALLILSGAMVILSHINPDGLNQALKAIAILEILFAGLIAVSSLAKECKSTLVLISVTVGILAVALGTLSMINQDNLTAASNGLSKVMAMFALLVASTSLAKQANGTLVVLTAVVAGLGGILYLLSGLPVESVIGVSSALSMLLLSLSASMLIISKAGTVAPGAYVTLGVMTLVVAGLAGIVGVLAYMNLGSVLEIAEGLSILLLSLSASCLILSGVGATGSAAFIGVAALVTLIAAVGGLMLGIGALAEYYPGMEDFLNNGIRLLESIGYGLGSFFGNIVSGFTVSATAGLPEMGENLALFMDNASPFFTGIKTLDESAISGVKALAETILILTAADILHGVASWLTGGSSLSDFATQLVPFGEAMRDFSIAIAGMDGEAVANAATAGKTLAEMASTLPNSGGVLGFFAGENDMSAFGEQLESFGEAMMGFADTVRGLDADTVANAATAGKAMAEMAATLPNSGGVLGFFAGENDMGAFGEQLESFGKAIMGFSTEVQGLNTDTVTNASIAGKAVAEMAATLPNRGGVLGFFAGENDMDTFGKQLESFGKAMKSYSDKITGINADAITNSTVAGKSLAELANTLPNKGGLFSWFTGDNDIGVFGESLVSFGENFSKYSDYMEDVKPDIVTATTSAATSIVELQKSLPKEGGWFSDDMTLSSFGSDMASFGAHFSDYYNNISGISVSVLSSVIVQMNRLVDMAKGMAGLDTSGMTSFSSALTTLGKTGVTGFINAFNNAESRVTAAASNMLSFFIKGANTKKSELTTTFTTLVQAVLTAINGKQREFQTIGSALMVKFIAGASSKETEVKTCFVSSISESIGYIKERYSEFYSSGVYLVEGFASGIEDTTYKAEAKATAMAKAAADAAKKELDEHSPSKVFYEIGDNAGEGFVEGLEDKEDDAKKAGENLAESATEGILEEEKEAAKASRYYADEIAAAISDGTIEVKNHLVDGGNAVKDFWKNFDQAEETSEAIEEVGEATKTTSQEIEEAVAVSEKAAEESKRLFNIMDFASDVVTDFGNRFGEAFLELGNTAPLEAAYAAVEQLALSTYAASQAATNASEEATKATESSEEQAEQLVTSTVERLEKIKEAFGEMRESLSSTISSQMDIFAEFEKTSELTADQLLANMRSQIEGVTEWANNLQELAERGINQGLLEKLAEMGPKGYEYVSAFISMTGEQLQEANDLYSQSATLSESATTQIVSSFAYAGLMASQGFANGIQSTSGSAEASAMGTNALNSLQSALQEHSPSKATYVMGTNLVAGFNNGIQAAANTSTVQIREFGMKILNAFQMELKPEKFEPIGAECYAGFLIGFQSTESESNVVGAVSKTVESILTTIKGKQTAMEDAGKLMMSKFVLGIKSQSATVNSTITTLLNGGLNVIKNKYGEFTSSGTQTMVKMIAGIRLRDSSIQATFSTIIGACLTVIKNKYAEFNSTGIEYMVKLITGVKSKDAELRTAFTTMLDEDLTAIRGYYDRFKSAGSYLVEGFCDGIDENTWRAEAEARAMAAAAAEAAEDELDEHSPSKRFYGIGNFAGIGFINALIDNVSKAGKAGREIAKSSIDGLNDIISKIADYVDADMDVQPTIRPVLDLSAVEAGTGRLNTLFSRNQALSVNTGMNERASEMKVQNGGTASTGNTYQFTQNNYSPKALSRIDIYRQTKNQFSAMERMMES